MKRKAVGLGIALLLLTSACAKSATQVSSSPATGKYGSGVNTDVGGDQKTTGGAAGGSATTGGSGTSGGVRYATPPPYNGGAKGTNPHPYAWDEGGTGRNAPFYIRANPYPKMVLEMVSAKGAEPEPGVIDYVVARLEEVLDKPQGIEVLPMKTFTPDRDVYTPADFAALEGKYMTHHSGKTGGEVVLHYLFLNGRHASSEQILGEAWRAGSIVAFLEKAKNSADLTLSAAQIERPTILHESGHDIGLLNWGYLTPRKHYAENNKTHSSNKASVMYYAIERADLITSLFGGGPPDTFDANDKADLADIRSGKIKPFRL